MIIPEEPRDDTAYLIVASPAVHEFAMHGFDKNIHITCHKPSSISLSHPRPQTPRCEVHVTNEF